MLTQFEDICLDRACRQSKATSQAHRRVGAGAKVGILCPVALRGVDCALKSFPFRHSGLEAVVGSAILDTGVEHRVHCLETLQVVECLGKHHVVLGGAVEVDVAVVLIGVCPRRTSHGTVLRQIYLSSISAEAALITSVIGGGARIEIGVEESGNTCLRRAQQILVGELVGEMLQQGVGLVLGIVVDDGADCLKTIGYCIVPYRGIVTWRGCRG